MKNSTLPLLAGLLLAVASVGAHAAGRKLTVFAAASLTDVLQEAGTAFTQQTGIAVRFSFAASSALARQIESGAPAGAFVSADEDWMNYLSAHGLIRRGTRADVARNSLVLVAPADSKLQLKVAPGFQLALALGGKGRIATADPDSVPAGKYAKAALIWLGVWNDVASRIVPAENVRSALALVSLGEAPLGIVYATDARGEPKVRVVDTFPADSHAPITYPAAVTNSGDADAAAFVQFLQGDAARDIFRRYGFASP